MMHSSLREGAAINFRTLQRELSALLPDARDVRADTSLELHSQAVDRPRVAGAAVIERTVMTRHVVSPERPTVFRAFLDGAQTTRVCAYVGTVPLICSQVSAVVRERVDRRLCTWTEPVREFRMYAPRTHLSAVTWSTLEDLYGVVLKDSSGKNDEGGAHPFALQDAAMQMVHTHREELECTLATRWCESQSDPLFVDGGISGCEPVGRSPHAVGVVKSHMTLYAEGQTLDLVLGLNEGERSSVFRITPRKRTSVASWYLRMRNARDRTPLWGLVRVEVADAPHLDAHAITARADEVSQWILAESSPLALPDGRWDTMVYGIRDCEEYLRALQER